MSADNRSSIAHTSSEWPIRELFRRISVHTVRVFTFPAKRFKSDVVQTACGSKLVQVVSWLGPTAVSDVAVDGTEKSVGEGLSGHPYLLAECDLKPLVAKVFNVHTIHIHGLSSYKF